MKITHRTICEQRLHSGSGCAGRRARSRGRRTGRRVLEGLERGEVGIHLALEDVLEDVGRAARAVDGEGVVGDEHGGEEAQALDVVPVGVGAGWSRCRGRR